MEIIDRCGHRTMCSILSNMRDCLKTYNFSYLSGLIEEAQYRAERMENALEAYGKGYDGIEAMESDRIKLKDEIRKLKSEKKNLKNKETTWQQEKVSPKETEAEKEEAQTQGEEVAKHLEKITGGVENES